VTVQIVVPVVTDPSPTTTIPALDAPEHAHLPSTGLSVILPLLISFQLILLGIALTKTHKIRSK